MPEPRRQLRWWRPGGLRLPSLARLTRGRLGLGRWTQTELDAIHARAAERQSRMFPEEGTDA